MEKARTIHNPEKNRQQKKCADQKPEMRHKNRIKNKDREDKQNVLPGSGKEGDRPGTRVFLAEMSAQEKQEGENSQQPRCAKGHEAHAGITGSPHSYTDRLHKYNKGEKQPEKAAPQILTSHRYLSFFHGNVEVLDHFSDANIEFVQILLGVFRVSVGDLNLDLIQERGKLRILHGFVEGRV